MRTLIVLAALLTFFSYFYQKVDPILLSIWGDRSGDYIDTYRTLGAKIWRLLYRSNSSWFFLWLPVLWMFSACLFQSVLTTDRAKVFNKVHIILIVGLSALALMSFMGLIFLPRSL